MPFFQNRNPSAVLLFLAVPVIIFVSAAFGAADISFITALKAVLEQAGIADSGLPDTVRLIVINIRLPRILLAAVAGAGLAVSGAVFQAVFENPLAEPYLLGVSSGASLGATIAIVLGAVIAADSLGSITVFAFAGAVLTIVLVLGIAGRSRGNFSGLLLGGIALGYIFQACISYLMMMNQDKVERIVFWMMGSFSFASWEKVRITAAVVIVCVIILIINAPRLNVLSLGADEAHSLGINPVKTGIFLLTVSCLLTAAVVATSGIIGFVGLIIPHLIRLFTGPDHRRLLPASAAGGACLLMLADVAARSVMPPREIPVGVITAFIGGPFFLVMLRRKRREVLR